MLLKIQQIMHRKHHHHKHKNTSDLFTKNRNYNINTEINQECLFQKLWSTQSMTECNTNGIAKSYKNRLMQY